MGELVWEVQAMVNSNYVIQIFENGLFELSL